MNRHEVPQPILNSPYEEPAAHWHLEEGHPPERRPGRRPAVYYYLPPEKETGAEIREDVGTAIEMKLVNRIRERVAEWRRQGWPGATRTTGELLRYWTREGRQHRLFFAQLEAAETIVFLAEARSDFRQGIDVPLDEPAAGSGDRAFRRRALKMATGAGKTTVMGMLAAWSILNKVHDRGDNRFSDAVLVVCPNVTIRSRLQELAPEAGDASIYRTRDLVPPRLMSDLIQGRLLVTNWHVFEPQPLQTSGVSARVARVGQPVVVPETIRIGPRSTTARDQRYLTREDLDRQVAAGRIRIKDQKCDGGGNLVEVDVESVRYVESDTALLRRVLDRELGGKQNLLVMNDEAHHAYRIRSSEAAGEEREKEEDEDDAPSPEEATVWVEGLDRIHRHRGINLCVDLSATPYFLARAGAMTNRPFPWLVADFGLTDAIESGLVKIPQFAVRDPSGAEIPGYLNIWRWILPQLTAAERGGKRASPKPEAILKYAHHPIALLGGLWEKERQEWEARGEKRPPVFILVCKNTKIAKVVHEWLGEDRAPPGLPSVGIKGFRNQPGQVNTIRVDSKVVQETDTGEPKSDDAAWMRLTLDTVGRLDWPRDRQGRPLYPAGFEELARKREAPFHPPGRDVRCIVSVGMLTEGWDCNTVTHVVGLRPFQSQLLCEQVVGRALRRSSYDVGADGRLSEEVAKVLGVPFQVIPVKENPTGPAPPAPPRHHVHAVPAKMDFEIRFPRVEGYRQAIRNRVTVDWESVAPLPLDPTKIPPEIQMKAGLPTNQGRYSLLAPGRLEDVSLNQYRSGRRLQQLEFELARSLVSSYRTEGSAPNHVLFPQMLGIVRRYLAEKVRPVKPADVRDVFLSPYYGWVLERLVEAVHPDTTQGEAPELPRYESHRESGSTADVDFWTSRDVREIVRSHLNYVVADTKSWEQQAATILDTHELVEAFTKTNGLGFAIPYFHNGEAHDYVPDFLVRLKTDPPRTLILEVKGFDPLTDVKREAADRWVRAVNADGTQGLWRYALVRDVADIDGVLRRAAGPA